MDVIEDICRIRIYKQWPNGYAFFGPLAAMYGRDIEQYLMRPDRGLFIPEWDFNESVHGVKVDTSEKRITEILLSRKQSE